MAQISTNDYTSSILFSDILAVLLTTHDPKLCATAWSPFWRVGSSRAIYMVHRLFPSSFPAIRLPGFVKRCVHKNQRSNDESKAQQKYSDTCDKAHSSINANSCCCSRSSLMYWYLFMLLFVLIVLQHLFLSNICIYIHAVPSGKN